MSAQIVLLMGLAVGFWLAYINLTNILLYVHMHKFLLGSDYDRFLRFMDDEQIFSQYSGIVAGLGYDGYHKVIEESSPEINDIFKQSMHDILCYVAITYAALAILPIFVFQGYSSYFLYGIVVMHVVLLFYKSNYDEHAFPHSAILMNSLVIRKYLKQKEVQEADEPNE